LERSSARACHRESLAPVGAGAVPKGCATDGDNVTELVSIPALITVVQIQTFTEFRARIP